MVNGIKDLKEVIDRIYNHRSLARSDLRNLYFSCMDFSGLDLRESNLEGCCLSYSVLDGCDLTNANLVNANLTRTSFKGADLTGASFKGAVAGEANFEGAKGLSATARQYLRSKGARGL